MKSLPNFNKDIEDDDFPLDETMKNKRYEGLIKNGVEE